MTLLLSRSFLGTTALERWSDGFQVALRRATVPADAVLEHAHETAHLILAVDEGYLSGADGAAAWRGPSMLVYNPPGTMHRDRFAVAGGRFVSINLPPGAEPAGIIDAVTLGSGTVRSAVTRVAAAVLADSPGLELEDALLEVSAALVNNAKDRGAPPTWLGIASEALASLADDATLRVHDLARLAGVHPVHLARVFANHMGCSPGEAIRRTRLERVASGLVKGRRVADLAVAHGFADHAHLTRCFRATYGLPPSAFRAAFG